MDIATARFEDCLALAEIHVTSWRAAYGGIFPAEYLSSLSIADRGERWRAILEKNESRTFVARADGQPVGFVSFGVCRDADAPTGRGEVWALYVAPGAWSTGAGWALWETARVQMVHAGFADVSLWVLSQNARGIRFFQAAGFRPDPDSGKSFEQAGARIEEFRLVFEPMTAAPAVERASASRRGASAVDARVESGSAEQLAISSSSPC